MGIHDDIKELHSYISSVYDGVHLGLNQFSIDFMQDIFEDRIIDLFESTFSLRDIVAELRGIHYKSDTALEVMKELTDDFIFINTVDTELEKLINKYS